MADGFFHCQEPLSFLSHALMKTALARIAGSACGSIFLAAGAVSAPGSVSTLQAVPAAPGFRTPHLADYDSELRGSDGRVDTEALAGRLKELGVTTYYWLVWHAATDWEDLKLFLPRAAAAHIEVWVYLVPPTEGPPQYPASEPFKLDYPRWGEEIARLSQTWSNLTAWVIDDFYANHQLFTPAYIRAMQARAHRLNPNLRFLPLMYFPEITPEFVKEYGENIDGVVVAYPQDRDEIVFARAILNSDTSRLPAELSCPWNTPTKPGEFISASVPVEVVETNRARVSFRMKDDFTGPTSGYHFMQVLLDNGVIWEKDVAAGDRGWREVELDVAPRAPKGAKITFAFRLLDKKGVSNFGVRWSIKDLRFQGLAPAASLDQTEKWSLEKRGPFTGFGSSRPPTRPGLRVPFIVMTAGDAGEFKLRHGEPATPERIAQWLGMCLETWRQGQCDGVVTYCRDKRPGSRSFELARDLFRANRLAHPATGDGRHQR